ncbi:suppressor of fused domain protein [Streptomyces sp. NPDC046985]|uniref:suppressor of fused domain protein n=1 Tax=Streptomyces sp. NPDC046985 TaxID=3155377 RepID=UPI00340D8714
MISHVNVQSYYRENWGDPEREAEFQKDEYVIGVLKWRASASTQGVNIYATMGASDYSLPSFEVEHRQEFFVGLAPECDDIASPLARLGIYAQMAGKSLGAGHVYSAPQGLVEGTEFSGFVLLAPLDGVPAPVNLLDGRHVEFLMAIPAFRDELEYASEHGVNGLMEAMESSQVPFWNPARRSVFPPRRGSEPQN